MKLSRKSVFAISLAVVVAMMIAVGGGTIAYLKGSTEDEVNAFQTNKVMVELTETTGNDYNIIPGTSQAKDPKVTVDNTVDSYVYVEVTDQTEGLVTYTIAEGWTKLEGYDNVYYREVAKDAEVKEYPVLKDNIVSYGADIENSDMLDESGNLKEGIVLTFHACAIQKEPFDNPKDAYEEMLPADSTLAVSLTYSQNNNPEDPKFIAETFVTEDSTLFQTGALKSFYPGDSFYRGCQYTFTLKGSSNKDMMLSFDFGEKCGEQGSYKDNYFEYGFGGFGDTFALAGEYPDFTTSGDPDDTFTLVGDYYPIVLTVTHTKGTEINFEFTGSLTALVEKLSSEPLLLKADTEYDEEFTITLNWPFFSVPTEDCYALKDGIKDSDSMDRVDTLIGSINQVTLPEKLGGELWADFEVTIK